MTHPDDHDEPAPFPEDGVIDELRADADTWDRTRTERRSGGFTEDDDA